MDRNEKNIYNMKGTKILQKRASKCSNEKWNDRIKEIKKNKKEDEELSKYP